MTKILLVDDEIFVAWSCKMWLTNIGYDVVAVFSGQEALERVGEEGFDVIITDISMNPMDGVALIRAIRKLGFTKPIIVNSAHVLRSKEAIDAGANEFVHKGIGNMDLGRAIKIYLPSN